MQKVDFFILFGLLLEGLGIFFWFGQGPSLTAIGIELILLGLFGDFS